MGGHNKNILNKYDYYAFISYSIADEKWAKWLYKHLENNNLPSALRQQIIRCLRTLRKDSCKGCGLHYVAVFQSSLS